MNPKLRIILLSITVLSANSCKKAKPQVVSIIVFEQASNKVEPQDLSMKTMRTYKRAVTTDTGIVNMVRRAEHPDGIVIWKGEFYGAFVLDNGDTSMVYFQEMGGGVFVYNGKMYHFRDKAARDKWKGAVYSLLEEATTSYKR
ncbi:hypothetical protein [Chitinophaga caeni]|nr:hypothetical protein [Chitinophaga caeni]